MNYFIYFLIAGLIYSTMFAFDAYKEEGFLRVDKDLIAGTVPIFLIGFIMLPVTVIVRIIDFFFNIFFVSEEVVDGFDDFIDFFADSFDPYFVKVEDFMYDFLELIRFDVDFVIGSQDTDDEDNSFGYDFDDLDEPDRECCGTCDSCDCITEEYANELEKSASSDDR